MTKKLCLTLALLVLLAANAQAAFVEATGGSMYLLKDTGGTSGYALRVGAVKLSNAAAGKTYRLHVGDDNTGAIIWEHIAGDGTTTSPIIQSPPADSIKFTMPTSGVYFDTDDTGSPKLFIYRESY